MNEYPQAMTIAGSDSDGSAGMQADLHTFFVRKVYGLSVITACVAGNSYGIHDSTLMPKSFIYQEFKDAADDFKVGAAKTGMLATVDIINAVVDNYQKYDFGPLVVDPVIITKHGNMLLEEDAFQTLKNNLLPLADIVTPNFYEAEKLTGIDIKDDDDMLAAAQALQDLGAQSVMVKGRHNSDDQKEVRDLVLLASGETEWLSGPYYATKRKNGSGDSLSACITAELAKGKPIIDAIKTAHDYVQKAIENEIAVGHKYGPINQFANY